MKKCGYGRTIGATTEFDCAGCNFLAKYPSGEIECVWEEKNGNDQLDGPTSHPEPLDSFRIIKCPKCNSEIAIDEKTIYPIDCDCGNSISKETALSLPYRY